MENNSDSFRSLALCSLKLWLLRIYEIIKNISKLLGKIAEIVKFCSNSWVEKGNLLLNRLSWKKKIRYRIGMKSAWSVFLFLKEIKRFIASKWKVSTTWGAFTSYDSLQWRFSIIKISQTMLNTCCLPFKLSNSWKHFNPLLK